MRRKTGDTTMHVEHIWLHWWRENYAFVVGGVSAAETVIPQHNPARRLWYARLEEQEAFAESLLGVAP